MRKTSLIVLFRIAVRYVKLANKFSQTLNRWQAMHNNNLETEQNNSHNIDKKVSFILLSFGNLIFVF